MILPFEFVATPEASPRYMSGGSLMKFGTESNGISGAEVDCAYADGLSRTQSPTSHDLMRNLPYLAGRGVVWGTGDRPAGAAEYRHVSLYDNRIGRAVMRGRAPRSARKSADFSLPGLIPLRCSKMPPAPCRGRLFAETNG